MVFSRSFACLAASFRSRPITSCTQLLITKKAVFFDHVAIDVNGLVGNALRLAKGVSSEQRRQREVGRHVLHSIQQLLRKINCKKSLLIAMDGAESLAKASITRRSSLSRRLESRLVRLPGTMLMQTVEERLVRAMPDDQLRLLPSEVVISGTGVAGCVEEKFSAWSLDLACREGFNANQESLCLIGGSELFLHALALTPYYDICSVVQGAADMKQTSLTSLLEWLELDSFAAKGDSTLVSRARTDALFLYLICNGCAVTELPLCINSRFSILWDRYHNHSLRYPSNGVSPAGGERSWTVDHKDENAPFYLFTDTPGHTLELDLENFFRILDPESRLTVAMEGPRSHYSAALDACGSASSSSSRLLLSLNNGRVAGTYLEHAMQSHAMLCLGYTPNPFHKPFTRDGSVDVQERGITLSELASHVKALITQGVRKLSAQGPSLRSGRGENSTLLDKNAANEALGTTSPASDHTAETKPCSDDTALGPSLAVVDSEANEANGVVEGGSPSSLSSVSSITSSAVAPYCPFWSPLQPLTAAEYTLLCQIQAPAIESHLLLYVGRMPKPAFGKRLVQTSDVYAAHALVQAALAHADPTHPHKCLCLAPSYCWQRREKTRQWRMVYVDLGVQARAQGIRRRRNAMSGMTMTVRAAEGGAAGFDLATQRWQPVLRFPYEVDEKDNGATAATTVGPAAEPGAAAGGEPIRAPSTSENSPESHHSGKTIKVLTWNVMFDRYSGQPTPLGMPGIDWCSPQRYPVLAKCIAAEDADVVGMQEVEPAFLSYLASQPWCRESYLLSCTESSPVIHPWGVLMLIHRRRLPVLEVMHMNVPAWSGHLSLMPVVTLKMADAPVHVSAVHLLAPFTKAHENARTAQDLALRQRLVKGLPSAEDCIAMGDFNDYPGNEFIMPKETQYLECWPMLHPKDPGKTMDDTNTFCKLKVEEMFFGRSDKIFLRSRRLMPVEAHLVGTKSVNAENGDEAAPAYLFPSDHYGVSMTFTLK